MKEKKMFFSTATENINSILITIDTYYIWTINFLHNYFCNMEKNSHTGLEQHTRHGFTRLSRLTDTVLSLTNSKYGSIFDSL